MGILLGTRGGGKVGLARILVGGGREKGGGDVVAGSSRLGRMREGGRMGKGVSAGLLEWGATRGGE